MLLKVNGKMHFFGQSSTGSIRLKLPMSACGLRSCWMNNSASNLKFINEENLCDEKT